MTCNDPTHPTGVDDLGYHLTLGQDLATPNGRYECWHCPRNDDGSAVTHPTWATRTTDHLVLMRAIRAEVGIAPVWNLVTTKQRRFYLDAALRDGMDPRHLDDFDPRTLKLKAVQS
jgi:hypothetical protein